MVLEDISLELSDMCDNNEENIYSNLLNLNLAAHEYIFPYQLNHVNMQHSSKEEVYREYRYSLRFLKFLTSLENFEFTNELKEILDFFEAEAKEVIKTIKRAKK